MKHVENDAQLQHKIQKKNINSIATEQEKNKQQVAKYKKKLKETLTIKNQI